MSVASANILCATTQEINDIGQALLDAYNDLNIFNEDLCDPNTRYVVDYTVQLPDVRPSDVLPFFDGGDGDGNDRLRRWRRTLTSSTAAAATTTTSIIDEKNSRNVMRRRELQQEEETPTPAPTTSLAPSSLVEFRDDIGNVDLFFEVTGSCGDCENDGLNLLSDDVVRRRLKATTTTRMLQQEILPAGANCTCSSDAEERPPTDEEWFSRFSALTQERQIGYTFVQLIEVDESTCRSELGLENTIDTLGDVRKPNTVESISIDITRVFGGPDDEGVIVTVSELEEAFVCTYNWLVTRYFCDPFYTSVSSATLLFDGPIVFDNQSGGSSSSNLTFGVNSTCANNCTGTSIFFEEVFFGLETVATSSSGGGRDESGENVGRWESPSGQCYCPTDGPIRVPTRQEFEDAFRPCLPSLTPTAVTDFCSENTIESDIITIPPVSAPPAIVQTGEPTNEPTKEPTKDPTKEPTNDPTREPTELPTPAPTLRKPLVTEAPTYGNLIIAYP